MKLKDGPNIFFKKTFKPNQVSNLSMHLGTKLAYCKSVRCFKRLRRGCFAMHVESQSTGCFQIIVS